MGGGPSEDQKRAEREAEERSRQQQAQAQQFIQTASAPDPLEERLRARDMSWMDWEEGRNGPRDVMNAPLGAGLDLYSNAARRQSGERMGIGALRLGMNEGNPMLSQLLNQQSEDTRQQEAAGGLEQAVRMKSAEVNRSALPLAEFAQGRRMGLASLASGNANNTTNSYLQFLGRPRQRSFWQDLLLSGAQGAGQAGMAAASDVRLKKNIETLKGIHAVNFAWNENARAHGYEPNTKAVGLIADEVEAVLPQFVGRYNGIKGIDYMGLSAYLLEMVKELSRKSQ